MSLNQLIFRNLKKNLKNYYLYVFALIFSSALYFSFVTLQYDPSMDEMTGSIKGGAALRAASVLLVAIVSIFLIYANNLFIKRRSKEIGLFQLIGMTKGRIFRILTLENFLLYSASVIIGIGAGFAFSKLILMILFKIIDIDMLAELRFSPEALLQTAIVFAVIYLLIMLMNYLFIKRQSILSLFKVTSSTETRVRKLSIFEILIGIVGITLILTGYYVSSKLFSGDFTNMNRLFMAMIFILASVIIGTYLFFKGSVSFIFNLIRKSKNGYLNINEVLSLSSIMFRMRSNAMLLSIITTVSALAIGLLSLSYISYYSVDNGAASSQPDMYTLADSEAAAAFTAELDAENIDYSQKEIEVYQAKLNIGEIMDSSLEEMNFDPANVSMGIISDEALEDVDVQADEVLFAGYSDALGRFYNFEDDGSITLFSKSSSMDLRYIGLEKQSVVPYFFSGGGFPAAIVDEGVFTQLQNDLDPEIQYETSAYIGMNIKEEAQYELANEVFNDLFADAEGMNMSRMNSSASQKLVMGLAMFIVGFLGLTFLITSGCILYFKQMDESEEEKPSYVILRKLGFTQWDLLRGIQAKQLFSFGIPLVLGLSHSYFAVQSGWFFFGNELWTPMLIVMVVYTGLYSIFGVLSLLYYKRVIREAL
ncbi:FtsX-like permease family protein [Cytobacillus gottheilii]|uniref:FtsX-like permease family protein n=1 Tax=Cytobacillus gottheilii TaxID=859144 RepID=A0ABX8FBA9_9BACI|nr:ABC transporter permease [Cytobacillus gottheilii]QVY61474.1 FtsX-like permease family protein [Cytobacillus gottheilii]